MALSSRFRNRLGQTVGICFHEKFSLRTLVAENNAFLAMMRVGGNQSFQEASDFQLPAAASVQPDIHADQFFQVVQEPAYPPAFPVDNPEKSACFIAGFPVGQFGGTQNTGDRVFQLMNQVGHEVFQVVGPFLQSGGQTVEGPGQVGHFIPTGKRLEPVLQLAPLIENAFRLIPETTHGNGNGPGEKDGKDDRRADGKEKDGGDVRPQTVEI